VQKPAHSAGSTFTKEHKEKTILHQIILPKNSCSLGYKSTDFADFLIGAGFGFAVKMAWIICDQIS
jgi:hypothetical protein